MTVVCTCGQRLRARKLTDVDRLRCPKCGCMIAEEANRQAARNAAIVFDLAALLLKKEKDGTITTEELALANVMATHELRR